MPTYVYGCDMCGHRFEKVQRFSDEPIKGCPACEGKVRRIFQPAGIVFKGSGWHINDYKRAGKADGEGAKADSEGAKAEGSGKDESVKAEGSSKDGKESASKDGTSKAKESTSKESPAKSGGSDATPARPAS